MHSISAQQTITVAAGGKCIVAGEHTVLRGGSAIVFPIANRRVTLTYVPQKQPLSLTIGEECESALSLLFWGVMDTACAKIGRSRAELHGQITLQNSIPLGRGMGFSAAFCVAITKWLVAIGWLDSESLTPFSIALEDTFHGKSSGVDVIGALSSQGVWFSGDTQEITPVVPSWQPFLGLSHSGRVSVTAHCVKAVRAFCQSHPEQAWLIDNDMKKSCIMVKQALEMADGGLEKLAEAIQLAHQCFVRWGLVPDDVARRIQQLEAAGALAVKMTGAGEGGYLLSLWSARPPQIDFDECLLF